MNWAVSKRTLPGLSRYRPPHAGLVVLYRVEQTAQRGLAVIHDDPLDAVD